MSDVENQIISSRFVKEIAQFNGDLKKFTTNTDEAETEVE